MIDTLKEKHEQKKKDIENRLLDFKHSWQQDNKHVFGELCFCLLTPQSKAKSCWRTIEKLKETGLLYNGTAPDMKKWMASVRFNENKSKYLVLARELFTKDGSLKVKEILGVQGDAKAMRAWLIEHVKGMGYKEAGHFLRNVGFGEDIAILDRHILKNLLKYNVIEEIPKSLTPKKYLEIEEKMKEFALRANIPFDHLDLLWWSEEAGEIFK